MATCVAMLLGRTLWTRGTGGWGCEAPGLPEDAAAAGLPRMREVLAGVRVRDMAVVYEPEGLAHQVAETPKVSRAVFATLARIRSEHPVVASEDMGWGIDPPEPGPGGAYTTQIHSEYAPGLVGLSGACGNAGCRLSAAWSAYTVAAECLRARPGAGARIALILAPDYAAVATFGAKRSYRAWCGALSEKDWRALSALVGDLENRPPAPMAFAEPGRRAMIVVAQGDPGRTCPLWTALRASGRVEAVIGLEEFASIAGRISAAHPANLVGSFPRRLDLDRPLAVCGVGAVAAAAALGLATAFDASHLAAERRDGDTRVAALQGRLGALEANRREMERLRSEAPEFPGNLAFRAHLVLESLAPAIPDSVTLTSFSLERTGQFELEAMVAGPVFDAEGARRTLAGRGFAPAGGEGWRYDPAVGSLRVRGRYGEALP
jgi:hypothetical protein